MLEQLSATWKQLKGLRKHPDPGIRTRVRTILRNKMRLSKKPDDIALQAQIKRNLADLSGEIAKQSH